MTKLRSGAGSRRHSLRLGLLFSALVTLAAAPTALADSTQSSNWAGYAVHRSGVRFQKVIGTWRQPSPSCNGSGPTYSSVWVGLGGFNLNAKALEQIGSEVDCSPTGKVVSSAWYELVPAPSRSIRLRVNPGDRLSASVIIKGHQTKLTLHDLSRRTSFTRSVHVKTVDVSSAEWIVEAPSECTTPSSCQTLNLADFGTAAFTSAKATNLSNHTGSISDRHWGVTRITLATGQRHFIGGASTGAQAAPSPLTAGGSAFSVTYRGAPSSTTSNGIRQAGRVSAISRLRPGGARRSP
jgi:hypothetical protein